MERTMDGLNGGMDTTMPMPEMGGTDGGGAARPRPKRTSRPKAAKKTRKAAGKKRAKPKAKAKARAKTRKSSGSKRAKKRGRR
jgi:hypothetical protein